MSIDLTYPNDPLWVANETYRRDAARVEIAPVFKAAGIFEITGLVEARLKADERTVRIKSPLTPLYKRGEDLCTPLYKRGEDLCTPL